MRDKIVRAVFGSSMTARTEAVWQYDYGRVLVMEGLELPESYEVFFGVAFKGEAVKMIGNAEGVDIPDELLELGKTIYAWLFLHTGESDGETVAMATIPVNLRPKGSDVEPTPVQQDVITQTIAALNAGVERAEEAAETAEEAVERIPALFDDLGLSVVDGVLCQTYSEEESST